MNFKSGMQDVIVPEKMKMLNRFVSRKGWLLSLSILLSVNGCVEWKCDTFFNRVHAILNGGKSSSFSRNSLWTEATNKAIFLDNALLTPNRVLSPFQLYTGEVRRSILSLMQKFGEVCITTHMHNLLQAKLGICGTPGIWVDFAEGHPVGTYQELV